MAINGRDTSMHQLSVHFESDATDGLAYLRLSDGTEAWAKGYAFRSNTLLISTELARETAQEFLQDSNRDELLAHAHALNGSFCYVVAREGRVMAVVDRVRSRPLFYALDGSDLLISDSAYWIKEQLGTEAEDPLARQEYLLTGYVTGADTLDPRIKQFQAGEVLIATSRADDWGVETERYYTFGRLPSPVAEQTTAQFRDILQAAFQRLVRYANGRTIVIPLSGGYDSRLIALMLKEMGYSNVVAFTFGQQGNTDSELSRAVAEALNIPWHFIEYTNEKWYRWYRSAQMRRFLSRCDSLCAFPYISTWPALGALRVQGLVPDDAVIAPGFQGFSLGGTVSLSLLRIATRGSTRELIRYILNKHYNKWIGREQPALRQGHPIVDRLTGALESWDSQGSERDLIRTCLLWEWQERQAKAIVNVARIYESWNYDWYLLTGDSELLEFSSALPTELLANKRLLKQFVTSFSNQLLGVEAPFCDGSGGRSPLAHLIDRLPLFVQATARRLYRATYSARRSGEENPSKLYWNQPWALYGILTEEEFLRYEAWRVSAHALWIWDKLGAISLSDKPKSGSYNYWE